MSAVTSQLGKVAFPSWEFSFFEYNHLISILLTVFITDKAWKLVVSLLLSSLKVMVVGRELPGARSPLSGTSSTKQQ